MCQKKEDKLLSAIIDNTCKMDRKRNVCAVQSMLGSRDFLASAVLFGSSGCSPLLPISGKQLQLDCARIATIKPNLKNILDDVVKEEFLTLLTSQQNSSILESPLQILSSNTPKKEGQK